MLHRVITSPPAGINPQGGGKPHTGILWWVWKLIYILVSFELGIVLLYLPWGAYWENNYFLYLYPQIRPLVANSFFKGFVLGLGILNILIGVEEVVHFKEKKGFFSG